MPNSHKKQRAAAIRRLGPCQSGVVSYHARRADTSCPAWGMAALGPSHHRLQQQDVPGLQGQSVLAFPLKAADLSVKLPPGLQLAATPTGHLDCRMQLLGVQLDWPAGAAHTSHGSGTPGSKAGPQVLPARSTVAGFACRSGALLLAHALFPDHTQHLLAWLAVPVAVADTLGVVAAATPAAAQRATHRRAQQLKTRLQGQPGRPAADSSQTWGWVDGVQGVVEGSLHTFRALSGPAAVLATGSWLWGLVSPSSHMLCSAVVALMAVAADYNSLGRDVALGKIPPGKAVEAAWRARHKAAAQRLAEYCGDLPSSPPLAPFIDAASHCSIAAGLAFGGCGLSGQLPPSLCSPTGCSLTTGWPLGQQGIGHAGGRDEGSRQLVLSGSVVPRRGPGKLVHEAAGLNRSQLLELFTGNSQDEGVPPAPAGAATPAALTALSEIASGGAVAAAVPNAVPVHEAPAPAGTSSSSLPISSAGTAGRGAATGLPLLASTVAVAAQQPPAAAAAARVGGVQLPPLRSTTDSASERSVDAIICIKRRLPDKPEAPCSSSRHPGGTLSRTSSGDVMSVAAGSVHDPLAFLDDLPLYGQQDHAHLLAAQAAAAAAAGDAAAQCDPDLAVSDAPFDRFGGLVESVTLWVRAAYLLLAFAPFLLCGLPLLLLSWWLLTRAAATQQQQQEVAVVTPTVDCAASSSTNISTDLSVSGSKLAAAKACVQELLLTRPSAVALQLLQHVWRVLLVLLALLDLLFVLLLGGHWAAGVSAWESAGMWLRKRAWLLLHFSCSRAGAAFIKWGQWSASRRDIFPADFCDVLSTFHDRAPVHSYRHTRRQVKAALGVDPEVLFDSFDPKPLASGSIAQVHKATLKPDAYRQYIQAVHTSHDHHQQQQQQAHSRQDPGEQQQQVVVVKVCHPRVAEHIKLDFKLVAMLSAAASKLPLLRGLPLRESVAQFSHTMTAQTDLRVEAVHALRFHNNFAGVKSSVTIPRPIPGLVSSTVLVESFEEGRSVAVFMQDPHPINTQIVALGVDAFLKMLLVDNFVHTDLHPGNILFRSLPDQAASRKQVQAQQQQKQRGGGSLLRRLFTRRDTASSNGHAVVSADDSQEPSHDGAVIPQWERELLAMSAEHQQRWESRHGALANATPAGDSSSSSPSQQVVSGPSSSSSSSDAEAPETAQLVLLDFGLAEQLTQQVRYHFISFLNAISAGDGLAASHHLLRWSSHQTCPDKHAFRQDMADLFSSACNIHSPQGIDLAAVMTAVLGLSRKHGVMIDSCYASLVISVCVLVGFGKALDPQVNLMDAATPTLLAYALTGKVVGRLYS